MLIAIERRASCSMFARSCKHPIRQRVVVQRPFGVRRPE